MGIEIYLETQMVTFFRHATSSLLSRVIYTERKEITFRD